jgi:ABC-type multidrug transport system ATPase subunit
VRRPHLDRLSLAIPVGARVLVASDPPRSASVLARVLAGLSRPRRGRVSIAGAGTPSAEGWGRRVAHVGPEPAPWSWMSPRETLGLAAELLELPAGEASRRIARALGWVRLDDDAAHRSFRRGDASAWQRTTLAAALLADPEVLILDDPLRSVAAAERSRMLRLPGRRRTIVFASSEPAREAGLVTHIAYIRAGRLAYLARVEDLAEAGHDLSPPGLAAFADAAGRAEPAAVSARGMVGVG